MFRWFLLVYGIGAYVLLLASFLYSIGFVGGFFVPKTIDSGATGNTATELLVNMGLLGLFALQHSVMARPAFKRWWTGIIPAAIERSTYVLASGLALILLFWLWRPLPEVVWKVNQLWGAAALWAVCGVGWFMVLVSTFLISHFDLFGLRQVFFFFASRPEAPLPFQTPWLYRVVRHPLLLGFLIAFWATPSMTRGHLLFAAVVTVYVLIAVQLEERDLRAHYGEAYVRYTRQVGMLLPLPRRRGPDS